MEFFIRCVSPEQMCVNISPIVTPQKKQHLKQVTGTCGLNGHVTTVMSQHILTHSTLDDVKATANTHTQLLCNTVPRSCKHAHARRRFVYNLFATCRQGPRLVLDASACCCCVCVPALTVIPLTVRTVDQRQRAVIMKPLPPFVVRTLPACNSVIE